MLMFHFSYISVALVLIVVVFFSMIVLFCFLINEGSTVIGQAVVVSLPSNFMYSCIKIVF